MTAAARHGLGGAVVLALAALPARAQSPAPAPVARIVPHVDTLHGEVRTDNYFWLRQRENPEVMQYLEAENAYTAQGLRHTEALQETIYREIVARVQEDDRTVPEAEGGYFYYSRTAAGKNYRIHCRTRGSERGAEEVILDENAAAAGRAFYGLGGMQASPDGRYLLFLEDTTARRWYTLRVKDLQTGAMLPDVIDSVTGSAVWASDNRTLFYTLGDSARRDNRIVRHVLGTPAANDVVVAREDDLLYGVSVHRFKDGRFLGIEHRSYGSTEWQVIDALRPLAAPVTVEPRRPDVEYVVDHWNDRFLIRTNDGAVNFRLMEAPEATPGRAHWAEFLPYQDSVFTEGLEVFRTHLVLTERHAGLRTLRVVDRATKRGTIVTFPEAAYGVEVAGNRDYDARRVRFTYSSFVTPPSVYDYDLRSGRRMLRKRTAVRGGFDPVRYTVARFEVRARDGAMVPVSAVYRTSLVKDGTRPLLLYAYGAYGASTEPEFDETIFSLVDRGVIYAIAHVRGGLEKGRRWYDDGKMLHKKNTFTDFIDVAQTLVDEHWTSPDRLVANGLSAGGLLMGAVTTMRPDLFRAVVADVPFVDVINTMRDASIPLTAMEWQQWGNPAIREQYDYMQSYSPYDNIERRAYPWLLVTTSWNDSQVPYWEPTKFTARLRALKTDDHPLFLKTNMAGGHVGSSGRYDAYREVAFRYAFMLDALGRATAATP